MKLISDLELAVIDTYEFTNGITKRGKLEPKEKREHQAIRAIAKHLTTDEVTDEDIRMYLF